MRQRRWTSEAPPNQHACLPNCRIHPPAEQQELGSIAALIPSVEQWAALAQTAKELGGIGEDVRTLHEALKREMARRCAALLMAGQLNAGPLLQACFPAGTACCRASLRPCPLPLHCPRSGGAAGPASLLDEDEVDLGTLMASLQVSMCRGGCRRREQQACCLGRPRCAPWPCVGVSARGHRHRHMC